MTFEQWYEQVDVEFCKATGVDRDSWPDADYFTMWESELSPVEAVAEAIGSEYGEAGVDAFGLLDHYEGGF
jgi:hypothetical protein